MEDSQEVVPFGTTCNRRAPGGELGTPLPSAPTPTLVAGDPWNSELSNPNNREQGWEGWGHEHSAEWEPRRRAMAGGGWRLRGQRVGEHGLRSLKTPRCGGALGGERMVLYYSTAVVRWWDCGPQMS